MTTLTTTSRPVPLGAPVLGSDRSDSTDPGKDTGDGVAPVSADMQVRHGRTVASCPGCTATWAMSTEAAHCSVCHRTRRSAAGFDAHRRGPIEHRRCLSDVELGERGYVPDTGGVWRQPRPVDTLPSV